MGRTIENIRKIQNVGGRIEVEVDIPLFGKAVLPDVFLMSTRWWADFMAGISVVAGSKAIGPVLYYSAYRLMKSHNEKGIVPMREKFGKDELFRIAFSIFETLGFGKIEKIEMEDNSVRVLVSNSFEARRRKSKEPVCRFVAGILAALVEDILRVRIGPMEEVRCQATGDDFCEFRAEVMEAIP